jgi:hypothetical protein
MMDKDRGVSPGSVYGRSTYLFRRTAQGFSPITSFCHLTLYFFPGIQPIVANISSDSSSNRRLLHRYSPFRVPFLSTKAFAHQLQQKIIVEPYTIITTFYTPVRQ